MFPVQAAGRSPADSSQGASYVTAPDPGFWRGKRVLVTGHTGFKGSWLSLWLHRLGARVTGFSLQPHTDPSLYRLADVESCTDSLIGDVRDRTAVRQALDRCAPEVVFHLAGQALVHQAYEQPVGTYETNVMGTANVLAAARGRPALRSMVMITSDKCYRNREWARGYVESDELGGRDPYSASEAAAELVIRSFRESWFREGPTGVASVRAGNVIGGGDWSRDRLIPDLMRSVGGGSTVRIRRPMAVRPWQHVLEALSGYLLLAESLWREPEVASSSWNIGPDLDQCRTVEWIADKITEEWGSGARWERDGEDFPHEDTFLRLDCTKIKGSLGWQPSLDLETALNWIVEWYRAYHEGRDLQEVTLNQIGDYEAIRREVQAQVA